jgi:hypothetical protein
VRTEIALLFVDGGELPEVVRTITEQAGLVVRLHGGAVVAAFIASDYASPTAMALVAARALARQRCRVVTHATSALVRRTAQGKLTMYGEDLEDIEAWIPGTPVSGLVLTSAAAELSGVATVAATEASGFFREADRDPTDATTR